MIFWYFQINFEILRFDMIVIFWYYHDISMFKNKAMMVCRTSKYQINYEILILSWYFIDIIKWSLIYLLYAIWYHQMPFDISFINHVMVIFWYYHDVLIFNNKAMMVAEYQIKTSNQLWDFENLILSWYFDIIKWYLIHLYFAISRIYFFIVIIFWKRNNHKCVLPRSLIVYQTIVVYQKILVL